MKILARLFLTRNAGVLLIVALLIIAFPDCHPVMAGEPLTIAALKDKDSPGGLFIQKIYTEAFQRLGLTFRYEVFPAKRASFLADAGDVDGEANRAYSYAEKQPNLIRVEETLYQGGVLALVMDSTVVLKDWDSLRNTDYVVNYRRGVMIAESNLSSRVPSERLEAVSATEHGLKKLIAGRCDVYIDTESVLADLLLSDGDFHQAGIQIAGVMDRYSVHLYLHVRHQALVPKLEGVLQDMKAEGLFHTYRKESGFLTLFVDDGSILPISPPD